LQCNVIEYLYRPLQGIYSEVLSALAFIVNSFMNKYDQWISKTMHSKLKESLVEPAEGQSGPVLPPGELGGRLG